MSKQPARRQFLQLAALSGLGGLVYASGLPGWQAIAATARATGAKQDDFYFVQLSDTHWGFKGAPNPDAQGTLPKAIAAVNALSPAPDFVIFTGDLSHISDDPDERRKRLREFRDIAAQIKVPVVHYMPGEHDASLDNGAAYIELFGRTHYAFDHKGVHFIAIDNVSDPSARVGDAQLAWLAADVRSVPEHTPIVVFTHRPLFDLYPQWDWATRDGQQVIDLLMPHPNVTVFYGHIHQEHHHMTGHIAHHSARSLMFPLPAPPAPGSQAKRSPLPWDASQPYRGLGWRSITEQGKQGTTTWALAEQPIQTSTTETPETT